MGEILLVSEGHVHLFHLVAVIQNNGHGTGQSDVLRRSQEWNLVEHGAHLRDQRAVNAGVRFIFSFPGFSGTERAFSVAGAAFEAGISALKVVEGVAACQRGDLT